MFIDKMESLRWGEWVLRVVCDREVCHGRGPEQALLRDTAMEMQKLFAYQAICELYNMADEINKLLNINILLKMKTCTKVKQV